MAPNAVIEDGKMRRIDPASEGRERLEAFLYEKHGPAAKTGEKIRLTSQILALPEEREFYPTSRFASDELTPLLTPLRAPHAETSGNHQQRNRLI